MRFSCLLVLATTLAFGSDATAGLRLGILPEEPAPTIANLPAKRLSPPIDITVREFQDAEEMRTALQNGDLELVFMEKPVKDIDGATMVSSLYPSVLHIMVDRQLSANTLAEILNTPEIWAGSAGGQGHTLASALANDYGIDAIDFLPDPWTEVPGVFFIFGGLLEPDALARLDGYRLHSLDDVSYAEVGSIPDGIALRYPNLYTFTLPAQLYPRLSRESSLTLAVDTLLLARADLDGDQVYELAMAIDRLQSEIAALYPLAGISEYNRDLTTPHAIALHPGAQRYIDRDRPSLLERYAEFVGATITACIGLATLGVALHRRRRQARKDRLDMYYRQALKWRTALASAQLPAPDVIVALRGLQAEVFELLVAERIDADAALLAFIALSNQLLLEAEKNSASREGF